MNQDVMNLECNNTEINKQTNNIEENAMNIDNRGKNQSSEKKKRVRKTAEQLLAERLTKQAELQKLIAKSRADVNAEAAKKRNKGLRLIGLVIEDCLKNGEFNISSPKINSHWLLAQSSRLQEKDRTAYKEFVADSNNAIAKEEGKSRDKNAGEKNA